MGEIETARLPAFRDQGLERRERRPLLVEA